MTYETGKTYRTHNGRMMKLHRRGPERWCGKDEVYTIIYRDDGTPDALGWADFKLLPGAIEDQPEASISQQQGDVWLALVGHQKQIDEIAKSRAWIDTFHVQQVADALNAAIDATNKRVAKLEHDHGPHEPTKRTIKGKWLNVYQADITSSDNYWLGGPFDTRAEALASISTARIACIQIPDFQEGEGL